VTLEDAGACQPLPMAAMSSAAEENDVGREYVVAAVAAGCGALLASASAQSLSPSRLLVLRPCHPSNATAAMCASPPSLITSVFVEMHHRSADGPWCMSTQTQSRTDSGVTCTPTADLPLRSSFVERKKKPGFGPRPRRLTFGLFDYGVLVYYIVAHFCSLCPCSMLCINGS